MLFAEIIFVKSDNYNKYTNTLCGQNTAAGGTCNYQGIPNSQEKCKNAAYFSIQIFCLSFPSSSVLQLRATVH